MKQYKSVHIEYTRLEKMIKVEIKTFFYHETIACFYMPYQRGKDFPTFYEKVKYRARKLGIEFNHATASGIPYNTV